MYQLIIHSKLCYSHFVDLNFAVHSYLITNAPHRRAWAPILCTYIDNNAIASGHHLISPDGAALAV